MEQPEPIDLDLICAHDGFFTAVDACLLFGCALSDPTTYRAIYDRFGHATMCFHFFENCSRAIGKLTDYAE